MNKNKRRPPFGSQFQTEQSYAPAPFFENQKALFLAPFTDTFEELLDQFFGNDLLDSNRVHAKVKGKTNFPKADISFEKTDAEANIKLEIALPGMKKEDISIEFDPETNVLTISGEDKKEVDKNAYCVRELKHSKFSRSWSFKKEYVDKFDERQPSSTLQDGILTVRIPAIISSEKKEDQKKTTKIEIE